MQKSVQEDGTHYRPSLRVIGFVAATPLCKLFCGHDERQLVVAFKMPLEEGKELVIVFLGLFPPGHDPGGHERRESGNARVQGCV